MTKLLEAAALIVRGLGTTGYELTPEQMRPWIRPPAPAALDSHSTRVAVAFFGGAVHTLGPMKSPAEIEAQWAD